MAEVPSFLKIALQKNIVTDEQINECFELQRKSIEMGMEISIEQVFINKKYLSTDQIKALYKNAGYKEKSPIEGYEFVQKLGEGGMGSVYLTKQTSTERLCAMKILPPKLAKQNPDYAERFLREARTVAKLQHPNIVGAYDTGKAGEYYYFVMEYVDGSSLGKLIEQRGILPEDEALKVFIPVAKALDYASGIGLVHRDIKPDNILLTKDGVPKVADFGLAKIEGQVGLTQTGFGMGTPAYISPEQAHGSKNLDTRADIYSLGCTLYHTVCGETPFTGENPLVVIKAHCDKPLPDPRTSNPGLSEGLCRVIKKMCAKKPENRYQSCAELVDALQKVLAGQDPTAAAQPEKIPVKTESKKIPIKDPSRESGKIPTRESSRESGKISTRETSRESSRESTRESARETSRPSTRSASRAKKKPIGVIVGVIGGIILLVVVLALNLGGGDNPGTDTSQRTDNATPKTSSSKENETDSTKNERTPNPAETPKPAEVLAKLKKDFAAIVKEIKDNPRDLADATTNLNALLNKSEDRDFSGEIKKVLTDVREKQNALAGQIRDKIKSESDELIKNKKFKAALEKMKDFPRDLNDTVAGKQLSEECDNLERTVRMKLEAIIKFATEYMEKNEFPKAKEQVNDLLAWDMEVAQDKARELLKTIEDKEKTWQEKQARLSQEKLERNYFNYIPQLFKLTKSLNFESATKLISEKSSECKDTKMKTWYEEDVKCVNRAHKFWDKVIAGLKGKDITIKGNMTGKFQEFNEEKKMIYIDLSGAKVGCRWEEIKAPEREEIFNRAGFGKSLDSSLFALYTGPQESTSDDIERYSKDSGLDTDHLAQVAVYLTGGVKELEAQKIIEDCQKLFADEKWELLQDNIDKLHDTYSACKIVKDSADEIAKWSDGVKKNLTPSPVSLLKAAAAEARAFYNDKKYDELENKINYIQNNFKDSKLLGTIADDMTKWKEAVEKASKAAEAGTPEQVRAWIATLKNEKGDFPGRIKAAEMLGNSDSKSGISILREVFENAKDNSQVRAAVALALGKLKVKTMIPGLGKHAASGSDRMISENSATALGLMDDKCALAELINALQTQKAWYVRVKIIEGIGKYQSKESVSLLKDTILNEKMPMVSEAAAHAFINFPKETIHKDLLEIIQSPGIDFGAMKPICAHLVRNPNKDATKTLIKSLKDCPRDEKTNGVRGVIIEALGQLKDPTAVDVLMDIYLNEKNRALQLPLTRAVSSITGAAPKGAIYTDVEKWRAWYQNEYKRKQ